MTIVKASAPLSDRIITCLLTCSLIPAAWFFYGVVENKSWGRVAVGLVNAVHGMAILWLITYKPKPKQ